MTAQELFVLSAGEVGSAGRRAARAGKADVLDACISELRRRKSALAGQLAEELALLAKARNAQAVRIILTCRFPGCDSGLGPSDEAYCRAHRSKLEKWLREQVADTAEVADLFYIGRSNYPERRLLEHRAKRKRQFEFLRVLHWTPDHSEAATFEGWLIRDSRERYEAQCVSEEDGGGRWSGPWNCLYVAWTNRSRTRVRGDSIDVAALDEGRRVFPRFLFKEPPVLLHTKLTPDEAKAIIDARKSRLRKSQRDDEA